MKRFWCWLMMGGHYPAYVGRRERDSGVIYKCTQCGAYVKG